ncbi:MULTISPECIES: hypothetical protein [Terribacillus]|jgi:hypothetical protein|uniref:Uncharacterized protein n=2 Tax=Terribacillus saccharophilus TaxID=361277 RepID=A0ABX4GUN3_9BACI|nr:MULTISPECIES: hypothetical protein [Terribacillus]PAD34247.1 hypothetical protein CHH56_15545 [Terribacillus saccharophilus]PAD94833.1 hypothetical protein CHH50_16635 [Terribacillus saccharophilus]PAD98582.1 hypothetical protein CHH48_16645 [Terribacillus saccharophilus]
MSVGQYRSLCQRYSGKAVEIRCHDGKVHRGIIQRIDRDRVYLQPMGRSRNFGGFGYGGYGNGYGGGYGRSFGRGFGFGFGVAFGAIAGIALLSLFWI